MSVLIKNVTVDLSVAATVSVVTHGSYEKHHVIPVYMCGINSNIQICSIPKPAHDQIHKQLDTAVTTVNVLGRVLALSLRRNKQGKRGTKTVMQAAGRTRAGREALKVLLQNFYSGGSWKGTTYFSLGNSSATDTIESVFDEYAPTYVDKRSKTSWKACKR
jgi:hypothetical protein